MKTLYMVQSDRSRTGTRRDYRIFAVIGGGVRDVTRETCHTLGTSYDAQRNLFCVSGASPTLDARALERVIGSNTEVIRL